MMLPEDVATSTRQANELSSDQAKPLLIKGVVLAAGRGSRLGDATAQLPKPLMPVGNRVCIDFAIAALLPLVSEIIVVTGYMAEQVEAHLAKRWRAKPVTTVRNLALEAGNLTSLHAARALVADAPFILTNSDHLFPSDMYTTFFPLGKGVRIACERDRPIQADEMKVLENSGKLAAISKLLPEYDGAYIGTTAVSQEALGCYWQAFDAVLANQDISIASVEMVLGELTRDPQSAPQLCWIDGLQWYEVDTPEDLAIAREGLEH